MSFDDDFDRLVDSIPGFGGYFLGADGATYAYLTDLTQSNQARRYLEPLLRQRSVGRGDAVVFLKGAYDFRSLHRWKRFAEELMNLPELAFVDADEAKNRVTVGITDAAARVVVEEALRSRGVPSEAVRIELTSRRATRQTLSDTLRPPYGGAYITGAINHNGTSYGAACSLGFNVLFFDDMPFGQAGTPLFVTASHCTGVMGHDSSTAFYQPIAFANQRIGHEVVVDLTRFGGHRN